MSAVNLRAERQTTEKSQLTKLYEIMRETMESGFYGSVEVKFEAGKVTIIRKTESIKI
ncbi:MAG: hypothetical protein IJD28_00410 [Deferribacterales bacterium]|nr:hypothetical protein [Deferribacterales bacterium]